MKSRTISSILAILAFAVLFAAAGCRPEPSGELHLTGQITDARTQAGVEGVRLTLEEQVVEGGLWNGNWRVAGEIDTEADGTYDIAFQRANALAFRLTANREQWFPWTIDIDADLWRGQSEARWAAEMMPMSWLDLAFANAQPFGPPAQVAVRLLHTPDLNRPSCSNDWLSFTSQDQPDPAPCPMDGDAMLRYLLEVTRDGELTVVEDSVWIARFDTIPLLIAY